jgi:hypothetical protein
MLPGSCLKNQLEDYYIVRVSLSCVARSVFSEGNLSHVSCPFLADG